MAVTHFSDKVAAITGAGSGMGQALAVALAERGCSVAIADVNQAGLQETATRLPAQAKVSTHEVDVADREQVERFAADVAAQHGKINLVFNNAGVSVTDTAAHMSYENFEWLMNINFWGVVYGSKAFLPYLEQADEAQIVNTASIFGVISVPTQSAYNASKFAVRGFTYALREELRDTHIGVSCVQPGGVKTNIVRASRYTSTDNATETKDEFIDRFEAVAQLSPEQAADQILKGVLKNKAQILVGKDAKLLALLERIFPVSYRRILRILWRPKID